MIPPIHHPSKWNFCYILSLFANKIRFLNFGTVFFTAMKMMKFIKSSLFTSTGWWRQFNSFYFTLISHFPFVTFGHSWLEMTSRETQKPFHFRHTSDGKQILILNKISKLGPTLWDLIIVSPLLLINSKKFHRLAQNPSPRLKLIAKKPIVSFISFVSIIDMTIIHCLP